MCGVFGAIRSKDSEFEIVKNVLQACQNLEYRGYDSSGLAWMGPRGLQIKKTLGSVSVLRAAFQDLPESMMAMGHTRWATHGKPSVLNAHPMRSQRFALVHNGIIDHHERYRAECEKHGYAFSSDTDTETLVMMMEHQSLQETGDVESWMPKFLASFDGQWSIVWMDENEPEVLYAYCKGRPLFLARSQDGCAFISSDIMSLAEHSDSCALVGDKGWVKLTPEGVWRFEQDQWVIVQYQTHGCIVEPQSRGAFDSYMLKELHEQPDNIERQYQVYEESPWMIRPWCERLSLAKEIVIVACGSSYYAGCVARYVMERQLKKRVILEIASEFNYREPVLLEGSMVIAISQSGETADTLAALGVAKKQGIFVGVLCNVASSIMALEADLLLPLLAGPEIGVASTKAFSAQVFALLYLCRKTAYGEVGHSDVLALTASMCHQLTQQGTIKEMAGELSKYQHVMYVARDQLYPLAAEGALKLKELAYIHAESYAAGELKHGPIALIDKQHPTIALVEPAHKDRMYANIAEIRARSGKVFVLEASDEASMSDLTWSTVPEWLQSLTFVVPLQLLSYYASKALGNDVDRPRNLAKCVTVE